MLVSGLDRPWTLIDRRQFAAGFLFGVACTARLTIVFGAPFFVFVGSGGTYARRALSAGLGAAIPIAALLVYNLVSTGHLFTPVYDYLYQLEANGYAALGYNPAWNIEDIRYVPQNFGIMLFSTPAIFPDRVPNGLGNGTLLCTSASAVRGLFDATCPIALPRATGMSILLTSPAYLYVLPALRRFMPVAARRRRRPRRGGDRVRQPDALQPGLGPVRLPVQQRLRRLRPAARRHRDVAARRGRPARGLARRPVGGDQLLGHDLGEPARMVDRILATQARRQPSAATPARRRPADG